jgi:peptidoglycan hydrolase-like protein with peptidoglycan-binding domain
MTTSITATAQAQYGRVLLQITLTTAMSATVSRVHPDGTVWPLRDANPTDIRSTTGVGAIVWDHEAPLDVPVTYRVTSGATTFTSTAVTVPSDRGNVGSMVWLTHPTKPSLSVLWCCEDIAERTSPGRNGVLQILGRADPIAITDSRVSPAGTMTGYTFTRAEATKLRALLADGGTLCVRAPAAWDTPWFYCAIGDVADANAGGSGLETVRSWHLPYTVVAQPAGGSQGPVGATWADVLAAYATWTAEIAGETTWNAVQLQAGP